MQNQPCYNSTLTCRAQSGFLSPRVAGESKPKVGLLEAMVEEGGGVTCLSSANPTTEAFILVQVQFKWLGETLAFVGENFPSGKIEYSQTTAKPPVASYK